MRCEHQFVKCIAFILWNLATFRQNSQEACIYLVPTFWNSLNNVTKMCRQSRWRIPVILTSKRPISALDGWGTWKDSYPKSISQNIVYQFHWAVKSFFDTKNIATVVATLTNGVLEGRRLARRAKTRREDFSGQPKTFVTRSWNRSEVHHTTIWHFIRKDLTMLLYHSQIWKELSEIKQ